MKKIILRGILLLFSLFFFTSGIFGFWFLGCGRSVETTCPQQTLTATQVEELYQKGLEIINKNKMGDYHHLGSLEEGLPIIKVAALHGHRKAMQEYQVHFIQAGIIDMRNFMGYSPIVAGEEGMMWLILEAHLGEKIEDYDKETFRILLDPNIPFPDDFFHQKSGTAWMLQMLTPGNLDRARKQAYAWRECWL